MRSRLSIVIIALAFASLSMMGMEDPNYFPCPLHRAIATADLKTFRAYLPHIDPNDRDAKGNTPLHLLVQKLSGKVSAQPYLNMLFFLLERDVNPYVENLEGQTAMGVALQGTAWRLSYLIDSTDTKTKWLLQDLKVTNLDRHVIAQLADERYKLERQGIKDDLNFLKKALFHHAYHGNSAMVRKILMLDVVPYNSEDVAGNTPFMVAVIQGHINVVKEYGVRCAGSYPERRNNNGEDALYLAVKHDREDIVRLLFAGR